LADTLAARLARWLVVSQSWLGDQPVVALGVPAGAMPELLVVSSPEVP